MMAPRSSTVARVRRNADAAAGMRLRKKPKMAMAKAMSVAIGTVIAASVPPPISACTPRYTAIGVTMPPTAAMHGSTALRIDAREPRRISCLISRPTRKKKTAIRPSLIQPRTLRAWPAIAGPTGICQNASHAALVGPKLERPMDTAVASRSITLPRPISSRWLSCESQPGSAISPWPCELSSTGGAVTSTAAAASTATGSASLSATAARLAKAPL
mmetsp:Transcript_5636/g.14686  ORF Transcript_5636/g.14686 Transcript_5636/m.14686 type:complete len:216 (-) Transcript_5636:138-785(-)